jgi:hypothetical protein
MKLGTYIIAPEPISTTYLINPSHQSVCLYVYPSISLVGNRSVDKLPWQRIHPTVENVRPVVFYTVRVVSKESRRLVLPRTSCYLKTFTFIFVSFACYNTLASQRVTSKDQSPAEGSVCHQSKQRELIESLLHGGEAPRYLQLCVAVLNFVYSPSRA